MPPPGATTADTAPPQPGSHLRFTATAYCKGETTASGVGVRTGIAAADPTLLPVGTVVRLDTPDSKLRRHLDDHGHRTRRAGAHRRSVSVELPRSAALRTPPDPADGAAPRMEPAEQPARRRSAISSASVRSRRHARFRTSPRRPSSSHRPLLQSPHRRLASDRQIRRTGNCVPVRCSSQRGSRHVNHQNETSCDVQPSQAPGPDPRPRRSRPARRAKLPG